jgi:PadR family transcriptional regulator PadR
VPRSRALSAQAVRVLGALAVEPTRWRYGYELGSEVDLRSGSLYPILMRLADRGLLESTWETTTAGKPPRHIYRLTADGVAEVARLTGTPTRGRTSLVYRPLGQAT